MTRRQAEKPPLRKHWQQRIGRHHEVSDRGARWLTFRPMRPEELKAIRDEIKMMLHAHRDCLRNQGKDTSKITFDVRDGYFGEAFGIIRGLAILGYGYFGASNVPHGRSTIHPPDHPDYIQTAGEEWRNLKWWMSEIEREVLQEENYGGSNECDHCLRKYHQDGAGRTTIPAQEDQEASQKAIRYQARRRTPDTGNDRTLVASR